MEIRDIVLDIMKVSNLGKKEFLVFTNSFSQTRNITKEMSFLLINSPNVAIVSEGTKTTINISSKLPYEIIISHSLDVLGGLRFDGIYVDISTNLEKLKEIKELYPQININYYGIEDFIQRKMFEEQNKKWLNFSEALNCLKKGQKVAREGWKNKNRFIYYVPKNIYTTKTSVAKYEFGETVEYNAYIAMKIGNTNACVWTPSTDDCLANDWFVIE